MKQFVLITLDRVRKQLLINTMLLQCLYLQEI